MATAQDEQMLQIFVSEYEKLKQEQINRLGFRDNLIYANLIALTGIVSIVADDISRIALLLMLPMVCLTLGWTYLVNDEKISAIGRYVRTTLTNKIKEMLHTNEPTILGWELAHRSDTKRISRKIIQLFVDEFVFVLPGIIAISVFWVNASAILFPLLWVAGLEIILLLILGFQIILYADIKKGK